jgi:hypothetical protein
MIKLIVLRYNRLKSKAEMAKQRKEQRKSL